MDLSGMAHLNKKNFQCSISMLSTDLYAVVTGPNVYKFLKIHDSFAQVDMMVESLDTSGIQVEPVQNFQGVSTNYTCHTWSVDTQRPIVCTDMGDILLMNFDGSLLMHLSSAPRGY